MPPWNPTKAKVQLRLSVQRLRTLQEKKEAQAKASRRDIATLLERGKLETARVKVENIINEDVHLELLELLELYCELLIARFGLLDNSSREPDPGVSEGVCAIIHAAPRTELKELQVLRDLLMHKYGREFSLAVMENRDGYVTERVTRKLKTDTPSPELVDAYLAEIAKGYGIAYKRTTGGDDEEGGDGGKTSTSEKTETPSVDDASDTDDKARKLPDLPPTEDGTSKGGTTAANTKEKSPPEDDFDALAKRFDALKKR